MEQVIGYPLSDDDGDGPDMLGTFASYAEALVMAEKAWACGAYGSVDIEHVTEDL